MTRDLIDALLIGLGVAKAVEFGKEVIPWRQRAWWKSAWSGILCGVITGAVMSSVGWRELTVTAIGAWGISGIAHALDTSLRAWGDANKLEVLRRSTTGRSRL
jgi:hypothetical protein